MARVSDNIIVVPFVSCAGVTQVKSSCEVHLWCVYNGISRENHLSGGGDLFWMWVAPTIPYSGIPISTGRGKWEGQLADNTENSLPHGLM